MTTSSSKADTLKTEIQALVLDLVRAYTRRHEFLKVNCIVTGRGLILTVSADDSDQPCIVGTKGKHVMALKLIVAAIAKNAGVPIELTLLPASKNGDFPPVPYHPDPNWNHEPITDLLLRMLDFAMPLPFTLDRHDVDTLTIYEVKPAAQTAGLPWLEEFIQQVHYLFHAAGKCSGREIQIAFVPYASPGSKV